MMSDKTLAMIDRNYNTMVRFFGRGMDSALYDLDDAFCETREPQARDGEIEVYNDFESAEDLARGLRLGADTCHLPQSWASLSCPW